MGPKVAPGCSLTSSVAPADAPNVASPLLGRGVAYSLAQCGVMPGLWWVETPKHDSAQSDGKHTKINGNRGSSTNSESINRRNPDQKFNEARCAIGSMLHMNEDEYIVYANNALKGCDKEQYYVPLMKMWRKAKLVVPISNISVGVDQENMVAQGPDGLVGSQLMNNGGVFSETMSESESVTSVIVKMSKSGAAGDESDASTIVKFNQSSNLFGCVDEDSDSSDKTESIISEAASSESAQSGQFADSGRMQLRSSSMGVNNIQSFNYREEKHIDNENEQRGSVYKSSVGSDERRGNKST